MFVHNHHPEDLLPGDPRPYSRHNRVMDIQGNPYYPPSWGANLLRYTLGRNFLGRRSSPTRPVRQSHAVTPNYNYGTGGNYGSYSTTVAPSGPSQAEIDAANEAEKTVLTGARQGFDTLRQGYLDKTLPFARTVETGQTTINTGRVNNALNLRRSGQQIGTDLMTGMRSGGVNLANANALNSGAAPAMARAYALEGRKQYQQASNAAALKGQEFDTSQQSLDQQKEDTLRSLAMYRKVEARRVFENLREKLQALEKQDPSNVIDPTADWRLLDQANRQLDRLDAELKDRLKAAASLTPEDINAKAYQADLAGEAGNPFDYNPTTVVTPGGAPQTQLPISTKRVRYDDQAPTFAPDQLALPKYSKEELASLGLDENGDPLPQNAPPDLTPQDALAA